MSANNNNNSAVSSCMYSSYWMQAQRDLDNSWIVREDSEDFYGTSQITAPDDAFLADTKGNEDIKDTSRPLREKNCRKNGGAYKHVPHKDKPPQVVARRNARERRRVQAVNTAFMRLRKAVPIENARGKRISKVKTLQNAIEYINRLQEILQQCDRNYRPFHVIPSFRYPDAGKDVFDEIVFEQDL